MNSLWQVDQYSLQQSHSSCPAICAKYCAPDCPAWCCNIPPAIQLASSSTYCPQVCFSTCVSSCPTGCCLNTPQGLTRNTMSYPNHLLCPADCDSSCLATCPTQCCNPESGRLQAIPFSQVKGLRKGNKRMIFGGSSEILSRDVLSSSTLMVRSKIKICPDICKKSCLWRCPRKCCDENKKEGVKKEASTAFRGSLL